MNGMPLAVAPAASGCVHLQRARASAYPPIVARHGDYVANGVNYSTLLTDEEFTDGQRMSQPGVQHVLEEEHSCLATYHEGSRTASQIITQAAQQYEVNPKVILATLEKEQSLVTRQEPPTPVKLRGAMGYAITDHGVVERSRGFSFQVDKGTRLLRNLFNEGSDKDFPIQKRVDYGRHVIQVDNAATYALLSYTPHTRDMHLRHVGGGNHLFKQAMNEIDSAAQQA